MDATFFLPTGMGQFTQALNEILYALPARDYPLKKGFIAPGHRAWPKKAKNVDPKLRSTVLEVDAIYHISIWMLEVDAASHISIWKETDKVRFCRMV